MQAKVAVINSSSFGHVFPEQWNALTEFADVRRVKVSATAEPAELIEAARGCHAVIASVNPQYGPEFFAALPELVIVARHGIGFNNVAIDAATAAGVLVTKVEGYIEQAAVAEHALALMLSASRHIPAGNIAVRNGLWKDRASYIGVELQGKKIAVIGLGNIGSKVARILKSGFESEILAYDPAFTTAELQALGYIPASLEEALTEADLITLHCALTPSNYHLLNAERIARLKPGVIIVNTARGELVDDQAIIAGLRSNKIRCYATDVVEGEPILGDHPLCAEANAIIVPHLGGYTYESLRGMGDTMVRNVREALLEQTIPNNLVNLAVKSKGVKKWR